MENTIQFIFQIVILIFSVVIHEVSHGYMALYLGDKTAYYAGRLTLNPLKHLDPFGSVILPILSYFLGGFIFGWAKPVPYNPYNLRDQKRGSALVAAAGPLSNLSLAVIFGLLIRAMPYFSNHFSGSFVLNFMHIASFVVLINLVLAVFNLIPVPPLDGSKILFSLLPYNWDKLRLFLEQYGIFLLVLFILFLADWVLLPLAIISFRFLTGTLPFF